ncbi:hypothetical protein EDI_325260 [Entamoeba dispar SAW760]|uniref:Uncharacterized protein n=1 Tax=Entamoeba dispar (strain ATCC PRA-260 / SAW760) TaxID=370354 RepID=B0EBN7_ENTDS|nr:uncharacterized protein EDI_325260 [Entamoeba dispar SAW760]EDR28049.1 hypothetical protein EDI_325260 [Entamoeba dispar SAW760]|eukprot:EDR28049.1 hypothetical protein EDI_325260 [Entamoeba dispar SAW760]
MNKTQFEKYYIYDICYYCDLKSIHLLSLINKKYHKTITNSLFAFDTNNYSFNPNAKLFEGDFMNLFSCSLNSCDSLSISIGNNNSLINQFNNSEDEEEEIELLPDTQEIPPIDPEFDQLMQNAIKPIKSKVRSLKVFLPTKCLTSFKSFISLEKLTLSYDLLFTTFPTLNQGKVPQYLQKFPLKYFCISDVPLPLCKEINQIFSLIDHYCKKVIIPSKTLFTIELLELIKKTPTIIFFIYQFIHQNLIEYLPSNIIIHPLIVDQMSQKYCGYKINFTSFSKKYFPFSISCQHIKSIYSTMYLYANGELPSFVSYKDLLSLNLKEDKTINRINYDFTPFKTLTSLTLTAQERIERKVQLPSQLKELYIDCFIHLISHLNQLPNGLTALTLRQIDSLSIHLPLTIKNLQLRWFNKCTSIDNLNQLNELTECDIKGMSVKELCFSYSLMKLSLMSCHKLESINDYDFIFDLKPIIQDCPKILFN